MISDPHGNGSAVDVVVTDGRFRVVYSPQTEWSGKDSFSWCMTDSFGRSRNIGWVNLTINHVNQPPVPIPVQVTLVDSTTAVPILLNASDPDQLWSSLNYTLLSLPSVGVLNQTYWANVGGQLRHVTESVAVNTTLRNQTLLYYHNNEGSAAPFPSFTFMVTDTNGLASTAIVSFTVSCSPGLVKQRLLASGVQCASSVRWAPSAVSWARTCRTLRPATGRATSIRTTA